MTMCWLGSALICALLWSATGSDMHAWLSVSPLSRRQEQGRLDPLEKADSIDRACVCLAVVDPKRAVKEFVRSAAGQGPPHPSSLRTGPTLLRAAEYLAR